MINLAYCVIYSAFILFVYRLGLKDGKGTNIELTRIIPRRKTKANDTEKDKIKQGISNILNYGSEVNKNG